MLFALAAGTAPAFFGEIAVLVVAGAVIAYVFQRLGLVPIVGFLVTGVVIGPHGLGLVRDPALVDAGAEIGVVLLLFTVGIEFSLAKLARIKTLIFGGGGLQVALATLVTAGACLAFGVPGRAAVYTGLLVSLSSTVLVLKLLADAAETDTDRGQVSLGLLIFQDLAIIAMVLAVPALGGQTAGAGGVLGAFAKAGVMVAMALLLARRLMPPVLERVARTCSPELFLLTVVAICFGTAWLASALGVSLSLGAFLAGLIVSESDFSEHAMTEILPLQMLFNATFFVSVGMLLDLRFLLANAPLVLAIVAGIVVVKVGTTAVAVTALRFPAALAASVGFLLAQVGEFSFVLERTGRSAGLSPFGLGDDGSQGFITATVLLMLGTPVLNSAGRRLAARWGARAQAREGARLAAAEGEGHGTDLTHHVVVAGYGPAGHRLVRVLQGSGIPFLIVTLDPVAANDAEAHGLPVLRGDPSRRRTLELAGVPRAKMMVVPDDDPGAAHRILAVARELGPTMRVLVRTRFTAEADGLAHAGADRVVAEEMESIVRLFHDILETYQVAPGEMRAHEEAVRSGNYHVLRDPSAQGDGMGPCRLDADCFELRTVRVRPDAPVVGRTLRELDTVPFEIRSVRRGGQALALDAEPRIAPGDELEIQGSAGALLEAAQWFRGAGDGAAGAPTRAAAPVPARGERFRPRADARCTHLDAIEPVERRSAGCEACERIGARWVHLRMCLTCGHVGCCDSSQHKHATAHHEATGHPLMRSLEPGETWGWCFVDGELL